MGARQRRDSRLRHGCLRRRRGEEITVKTHGGDLLVRYTDEGITLSGRASLVYEGTIEY